MKKTALFVISGFPPQLWGGGFFKAKPISSQCIFTRPAAWMPGNTCTKNCIARHTSIKTKSYAGKLLNIVMFLILTSRLNAQTADSVRCNMFLQELKKYDADKTESGITSITAADTQKAKILWEIFNSDDLANKMPAQKERIAQLKNISLALNYKKGMANAMAGEAAILKFNQQYKNALALNIKALALREKIKDGWGIRWSYFNIGGCYLGQSLFKQAAPWYYKAVKAGEVANDSVLLSHAYNHLSIIHDRFGDNKSAITYCEKAAAYANSPNQKQYYAIMLAFLGYYYMWIDEYKKIDSILAISYKICSENNDLYSFSYYYNTLGSVQARQGHYGKAIRSLKLSNACEDSLHISHNKAYNLRNITEFILSADSNELAISGITPSQKYNEAIKYAQQSLSITLASNIMEMTADNYILISRAYEAKKDFKQALSFYKHGKSIKDSLLSAGSNMTIQQLKAGYEAQKQQQQIASLTKDKQLKQAEVEKQKLQRNMLMAACVLVVMLIGVTINRYTVKSKANKQIERTYKHLQETQQQLVQQGKLVALVNMTADVAHRIKDPIAEIKNLSPMGHKLVDDYIQAASTDEQNRVAEKLKANLATIYQSSIEVNNVMKAVRKQARKQTTV